MKKFDSKRKGFTLVELLIVIVVIGILSAMMMLSSSEAVSSARATTIVADLRNIKTAALAYYADHLDSANTALPKIDDILPYLTTAKTAAELTTAGYKIVGIDDAEGGTTGTGENATTNTSEAWFVKCTISGTNVDKIKQKLEGRAASTGLLKAAQKPTNTANDVYKAENGASVYMIIR